MRNRPWTSAVSDKKSEKKSTSRKPSIGEISASYERVALVCKAAAHSAPIRSGVYEALAEAGCEPNWISGVSIGAINAAIIAGNPPERRVERLSEFWELISGRKVWHHTPEGDFFRELRNQTSAWMTLTMGQPGFFKPQSLSPWMQLPGSKGATSYYDSSELRDTLERLIDFDLLNDGEKRLSVGAVNVRTGNFAFFDTREQRIGPEHHHGQRARCRRRCRWCASTARNTGTAASSPIHRCSTCSNRTKT